jgi:hypothetical protein
MVVLLRFFHPWRRWFMVVEIFFSPLWHRTVLSIQQSCLDTKVDEILEGSQDSHGLSGFGHSYNFEPLFLDGRDSFSLLQTGQESSHVRLKRSIEFQEFFSQGGYLVPKGIVASRNQESTSSWDVGDGGGIVWIGIEDVCCGCRVG